MQVTFVLLQLLTSLWIDDEQWQANVRKNGLEHAYTIATDGDDGDLVARDFDSDELDFVTDVAVYDFAGDANSDERFYKRDVQVYKDKLTGRFWVLHTDNILDF